MKFREVEHADTANPWQLRLFGKFSVTSPEGREVLLHNQKCEALLAVLAVHDPHGVSRAVVAEALWHDKPFEKRQESLRQALAVIRQHAGPDLVVSSRTHCGFGLRFPVESDYRQPELRRGTLFMPAQTGKWFEDMRVEMALEQSSPEETSVMSHCLEFLRWSARYDPRGMYAFFRTNRHLVRGLPPSGVTTILETAGRLEAAGGWADYWRGVVEDDLDLCTVHLRRALATAVREPDWELASEVCFELGKVYARRGDVVRARRIEKAANEVADRSKQPAAIINAARLKGTLLVHWGQMESGLAVLRESADQIDDPVRRMVVESTQALFEAMSGQYVRAARSLEMGEMLARETGHQQAWLLASLTRALLSIHEGPRWDAIPLLEATASRSYGSGTRQLGVYADEVSAKLHLLDRDRGAALTKLGSARQNRLEARMARTPLESSMVASVR